MGGNASGAALGRLAPKALPRLGGAYWGVGFPGVGAKPEKLTWKLSCSSWTDEVDGVEGDVGGDGDADGGEVEDSADAGGDELVDDFLGGVGGDGDDGQADLVLSGWSRRARSWAGR